MKVTGKVWLSCGILLITMVLTGCGDSIGKANELIQIGSFEQAVTLIEEEIKKNPKNKEAHLALGNCYASMFFKAAINGSKGRNSRDREKSYAAYDAALKIDPNFLPALNNYADLLHSSGDQKRSRPLYGQIYSIDSSLPALRYALDVPDHPAVYHKYFTSYYKKLETNDNLQLFQKNQGSIILRENTKAVLIEKGIPDKEIELKKYSVYSMEKDEQDSITFQYDTVEKLGAIEVFYRMKVLSNVNYVSGDKYEPYKAKVYGYKQRLYKRDLTKQESRQLEGLPWFNGDGDNVEEYNLDTLFDRKKSNKKKWEAWNEEIKRRLMRKHQFYFLSEQLPYVDKSQYRQIKEIGNAIQYKLSFVGWTKGGRLGYIQSTKVKAKKYLKTVQRYCRIRRGRVVFGIEDVKEQRRLSEIYSKGTMLSDSHKLNLLSGKAYVGTPVELLFALFANHAKVIEKYYVGGSFYTLYKNEETGRKYVFVDNLLKEVI